MTPRLPMLLLLLLTLSHCRGEDHSSTPDGAVRDAQTRATSSQDQPIDVVFVCQYGYAKSLVSSRHFERMAEERGLPVRVIARGITPTDSVPEPLRAALRGDGFDVRGYQPQALHADELAGAAYVVSFGNEVPESPGASRRDWGDVSALSEDYPRARDEIVAHLTELLDEIEAERTRR